MLLSTLASEGGQQQDGHVLRSSRNGATAQAIESNMSGDSQASEFGDARRVWLACRPSGNFILPCSLESTVALLDPADQQHCPYPQEEVNRLDQPVQGTNQDLCLDQSKGRYHQRVYNTTHTQPFVSFCGDCHASENEQAEGAECPKCLVNARKTNPGQESQQINPSQQLSNPEDEAQDERDHQGHSRN